MYSEFSVSKRRNNPRESVARTTSVFSHKLLNLTYDTIEFVDEIRVIGVLPKRGHKGSVIPNRSVLFSTEPLEHFQTVSSKLSQDCARVVQLV
jgi:hypothetical protein